MERVPPWVAPWLVVVVLVAAATGRSARADPQVPCYFVFGDSLVDNGNNNDIASLARANYPPYGIDFPGGATGRFSNGLTTVDAISRLLGFDDYIPAYAGANNDQLLSGVNFASAAAGIRDETGQQLGQRISLGGQLQNYQAAVQQLVSILGDEDSAANHLSQCIFTVGMGSNDYLNNYFMPAVYSTSRQYTPEQYADVLVSQYTQQLRVLYNNGARKVALMGVGQVGCSPNELAQQSSDGVTCVARINGAIEIFNQKLVELVDQFNTLPGAHFTYINAYGIFQDILRPDGAEQGMLRGGEEQRAGDLPALPDAVRQQERVPLLGRLPPHGGRQHPRREEGLQRRRPLRRPPRRPADACAPLVILYTQPPSQKRRMGYIYRSRAS
uniref:Predicted protein n=1 Tax=Hordeum vulgare subsp. vulgare TaxID=112509 RepID=F2D212_HORVV|nr:predicted protein [Hordeum vulgare subsp. vulgare]